MTRRVILKIHAPLRSGLAVVLALALLAAALLALLALQPERAAASQPKSVAAVAIPRRQYYLSNDMYTGSGALTACSAGYHMASVWEIYDPSNLEYNSTLGVTYDDSGFGPPTLVIASGWVRTGYSARTANGDIGLPNCGAWTSSSSESYGTYLRLVSAWDNASSIDFFIWDAATIGCNSIWRVWCVADRAGHSLFLPIVLSPTTYQPEPALEPQAVGSPVRKYYMSKTTPTGSQAASACASGYHMASIFEIADPSNLEYNPDLGEQRGDSGNGPPAGFFAWVRTGHSANTGSTTGQANCNAWTSSSASHYGSVSALPIDWSVAPDIGAWDTLTFPCNTGGIAVWCVED